MIDLLKINYFLHYNVNKLIIRLKTRRKFAKIFNYEYNCYRFYSFKKIGMAKRRREPMKKAKESWKKAVEWWKEFGTWAIQVVWWATWALWYTLLSGWEKVAAQISESREDEEWISLAEKESRENSTDKFNEKAKTHIVQAWKLGKVAVKWTWKVLKWWAKVVWHTIKGGYHLIDAWDKAIWEQIEKKQLEKGKKTWKIWRFFRDNIMKLMLILSLSGVWWYKATEIIKDKQQNKQGIVVKDSWTEIINTHEEWGLSFEERPYFQSPNFFDKDFKVTRDETYKDKWVILIRDAWMTFYIVQEGETTKEQIKEKLSSIPEFSYLNDSIYNNKIMGFNVPDSSLKKWLYIPIPVQATDRKINIDEFREYSRIALHEMENNSIYWKKTQELIKKVWEEKVINIMTAFARCETATDQEKFLDPIWTAELHRWEPKYKSFSFSYYHVLMEKNADGKTPWPWLKARQNLWLTEWQCYHPINAWKLFLWYCFEKESDPTYFFRIKNLVEAKTKWWKYNWSSSYWEKLWANIQHIKW